MWSQIRALDAVKRECLPFDQGVVSCVWEFDLPLHLNTEVRIARNERAMHILE
jgi:hypothetical protein